MPLRPAGTITGRISGRRVATAAGTGILPAGCASVGSPIAQRISGIDKAWRAAEKYEAVGKLSGREREINRMLKPFLIAAGFISLALGVLGILLPVLPTTPFVLLSGACFAGGSRRLYLWLSSTKNFGAMLRHFKTGDGIPANVRKRALLTLWCGLCLSALLVRRWPVWLLLAAVGIGVTAFLCRMKTRTEDENSSEK